jgi:hypothetical protein
LDKIVIKTDREPDLFLLNMIRKLFPECEIHILKNPDKGLETGEKRNHLK